MKKACRWVSGWVPPSVSFRFLQNEKGKPPRKFKRKGTYFIVYIGIYMSELWQKI